MHFVESALRRVALIACGLLTVVPAFAFASASARVAPGELRRDRAEAAFGREGGQDGARPAPTVRANRISQPLRIDGKLDEESYKTVPAITDFVQQEPDEFKPATERTEAWIFFDDNNIYISARNWESHPERRVANEMRRDTSQLRQNDTFGVLLDTFHDKRNGYIFYANAIGGLADSQVTDEGPPNADWNTVWDVRTSTFDGGWTIEMAIPFKSLRYQPGTDQVWGVNLRRVVRWKNEWSYLAQVPRALTTFRGLLKVSSAGTLEGLQVPSGSSNLELKRSFRGVNDRSHRHAAPRQRPHRPHRRRREVRHHPEHHRRPDDQHGLRAGGSRRTAGQPDSLQPFFPGEARLLPRRAGDVRLRRARQRRPGRGHRRPPYLFFSRRMASSIARHPDRRRRAPTGKAGKFTFGA